MDIKQIEHLAHLARLGITQEEKKKFSQQISAILEYFIQLEQLETQGVAPLAQVFDSGNVTREDKAKILFSRDSALSEAPEMEKNQIKVKLVLDKKK